MHMVSLALWPVAWAIGHTGTIALYNALISLVAGTSRVPEIVGILQWGSITTGAPTEAQVRRSRRRSETGSWATSQGSCRSWLAGLGFVLWVVIVSVLGPAFLHKLLTTGALFMTQAAGAAGRQAAGASRMALHLDSCPDSVAGPACLRQVQWPASVSPGAASVRGHAFPRRSPFRGRRRRHGCGGLDGGRGPGRRRFGWQGRLANVTIISWPLPPNHPINSRWRRAALGPGPLRRWGGAFSQLPEFMQQYLQRLEGHLDEARLALERFKDAAAQSGMSLDQLVAGAVQNPDLHGQARRRWSARRWPG